MAMLGASHKSECSYFRVTASRHLRNTAALFCMIFCIFIRMSAVEEEPSELRSLWRLATEASPALAGSGLFASPGLQRSAMPAIGQPRVGG